MSLVEWCEQFETGHPLVDHQHQSLFGLMNELDQALTDGASEEALWVRLLRLHELTREHFRCEERLMQELGFPDLPAHRAEHTKILLNGERLMEQYRHGQLHLAEVLPGRLHGWAIRHIQDDDLKMASFIRQQARC